MVNEISFQDDVNLEQTNETIPESQAVDLRRKKTAITKPKRTSLDMASRAKPLSKISKQQ